MSVYDYNNIHANGVAVEGTWTADNLMEREYRAEKVTIASGAGVLARATVLGKITSGGKYIKSLSAASDGSQVPDAILAHPVDATSADVEAIVFTKGYFNQNALILGTAHTLSSIKDTLRDKNIYIDNAYSAQ